MRRRPRSAISSSAAARHVYDYDTNRGNAAPRKGEITDKMDSAVHPIVWPHPETGEPILFISRLFTVEIIGLPGIEGAALLDELFRHIDQRNDDYSHKCRPGDFLIWDNRILQHARNDFPTTEKRAQRRVPVAPPTMVK